MKWVERHWWKAASALVVFIWIITALIAWVPKPSNGFQDWEETMAWRGTFGDAFGSITSLFSAFTIVGVAYGIYLQRKQLADAQKSYADQRFESTLFYLLDKKEVALQKVFFDNRTGLPVLELLIGCYNEKYARDTISPFIFSLRTILLLIEERPTEEQKRYRHMVLGLLSEIEKETIKAYVRADPENHVAEVFKRHFATSKRNVEFGTP